MQFIHVLTKHDFKHLKPKILLIKIKDKNMIMQKKIYIII